jgi:transcriptional regulator with XRE-family HTH domain
MNPLVAARKEAGLTQAALAEAMGVARETVVRWESSGRLPSPKHVEKARQTLPRFALSYYSKLMETALS